MPMAENPENKQRWYALRVTYGREMLVKGYLDGIGVESYIPMHFARRTYGERTRKVWEPTTRLRFSAVSCAITEPWLITTMSSASASASSRYWVVNNTLSIAQQWQITRMIERGGKAANDAKA